MEHTSEMLGVRFRSQTRRRFIRVFSWQLCFVLVDREGWMRGFRDGNDPEIVQKVLMDIGDVLREPSGTQPK